MENEVQNDAFSNLLSIIFSRKILVIIGFFSVFIVVALWAFLMSPAYEASTKILISLPAIPQETMPYLSDLRSESIFVRNQKEIIISRIIYEKVAKELRLHEKEEAPSFLKKLKNIINSLNPNFQAKSDPLEDAINDLYKNTSVDLIRRTNIIKIKAYSKSPEKAANIANAIARTYIDYANSILFNKTQSAYAFIAVELEAARSELTNSLKILNTFKKRENVISLMSIEDEVSQARIKSNELDLQYQQLQEEIQDIEDQLSQKSLDYAKGKAEEIYEIKSYDSPKIKELKTRLIELKKEMDTTLQKYTDNYPGVVDLRNQIAKLEEELSEEMGFNNKAQRTSHIKILENRLNSLKSKRDIVSKQIQALKRKQGKISFKESQLTKLTQDVNTKEKEYLTLKERLENARILKANEVQEGSIRALDHAFPPPYPDNKKKKILLAIGFIVSILFGLGMAFIADYLDDSFKDHEETEQYLNLPVLATIPPITKKMRKESMSRK